MVLERLKQNRPECSALAKQNKFVINAKLGVAFLYKV